MRINILIALLILTISGCATASSGDKVATTSKADINIYNPYAHNRLPEPNIPDSKKEELAQIGAKAANIQDEVSKRPRWKEEIYPIIFGPRVGKHEVLVFIDFSKENSKTVWKEILALKDKLNPNDTNIVMFGLHSEKYGTELMGYGIWASYARPAQGMAYFNFALNGWDNAKKNQVKKIGKSKTFIYEYDSVATDDERPFIYDFFTKLSPPLPDNNLNDVVKYGFEAGNLNAFQTRNIMLFYGIKELPAVIADGKLLKNLKTSEILSAIK